MTEQSKYWYTLMKQHLLLISLLVFLSAVLGVVAHVINEPIVADIFYTSLALTVTYLIFPVIIGPLFVREDRQPENPVHCQ